MVMMAAAGAAHGSATVTPIALQNTSGIYGPNTDPGEVFANASSFTSTSMNHNNQVMFTNLAISATGQGGHWLWNAGAPNMIRARSGVTASPFGGTFTASFNGNLINDAGMHVHREGTTTTAKLYANNAGTYIGIARGGGTMAAADASGAAFSNVFYNSITNSHFLNGSNYAFASSINGAGTNTVAGTNDTEGLWIGDPTVSGGMKLALRRNDIISTNTRVGTFTGQLGVQSNMALNSAGRFILTTASTGGLQGSDIVAGAAAGNDQALLTNRSGSLEVLAQRGQIADPSDGARFRIIGGGGSGNNVALNSSGRVAFYSTLRDGSIPTATTNISGVFTDHNSAGLQVIARSQQLIPASSGMPLATGTTGGAAWGTIFADLQMNNAGKIAFRNSSITGTGITLNTNDSGIFTKAPTDISPMLLAQANDHAAGVLATLDVRYQSFGSLAMNGLGAVAFTANFVGTDVVPGTGGTNTGLYAQNPDGDLCLVLRRGFDVNLGTSGPIVNTFSFNSSSGSDGRFLGFNDKFQMLVNVSFTDGTSGVYMFSIPAPGAMALLPIAGALAARRRRAR